MRGSTQDETVRRSLHGRLLHEVTARIAANLDLDAILDDLVEQSMAAFGADRGMVSLRGPGGLTPAVRRGLSDSWVDGIRELPAQSLGTIAVAEQRAIASLHYAEDPRGAGMREMVLREGFDSLAVAPLIANDEILGFLALYHDQPRPYDEAELDVLLTVAAHAAIAIRHSRDFAQLAKWAAQLQSIQALGARLSGLRTVAEIASSIVTELDAVIRCHNVRVYRIRGDDVVPIAMRGRVGEYENETPDELVVKLGVGITGWVAEHGVPQSLPDAAADPRARTVPGTEPDLDESMLLAPMVYDGRALGVISLSRLGLDQFDPDDLRLLEIFASFAAGAMASADAADLRMRESEARYRELVEHVPAIVYTAEVGADGRWTYVSPRVEGLLGFPAEDWTSTPGFWRSRLHPDDRDRVLAEEETGRTSAVGHRTAVEYRLIGRDGAVRWVMDEAAVVHSEDGSPPHWSGFLSDITERQALSEQLQHQAFHDPLTGLANRALFADRVDHALARSGRRRDSMAVLFLDLDDFKNVNDGLGHDAGDALLVAVSEAIRSCLRPMDTAARLGGDEFGILIEDTTSVDAALEVAQRIRAAVARPFEIDGREIYTNASIGISQPHGRRERAATLLRNADGAMYAAKRNGKGRCEVYEPALHAAAVRRLELHAEIRQGLALGEFALYYQPTMLLSDGSITGFEGLLRWNHPRLGLVMPAEFITAAEETGQIVELGQMVLREACRQGRAWRDAFPEQTERSISVNVSARQFRDPSLGRMVTEALAGAQLDPRALILEITESVLMEDTVVALRRLGELKALGVRLAIDDFGTGYSSLSYLRRLPVDILKIDKSFIDGIVDNDDALALAGAVVRIGRTLRLSTVAEGVEEAAQVASLRGIGCEQAQGFHYARPMPADEVDVLLRDTHARRMAG